MQDGARPRRLGSAHGRPGREARAADPDPDDPGRLGGDRRPRCVRRHRGHVPDRLRRDLPRARLRVPGALRDQENRLVPGPSGDGDRARHRHRGRPDRAALPRPDGRLGAGLPARTAADHRPAALLGRALLARGHGDREEPARGGGQDRGLCPGRGLPRAGHRRRLLHRFPCRLHDPLHLPVLPERRAEHEERARERAHARRGRALARGLGARDGVGLPVGDWPRRHRDDRRDDSGRDGLAPRARASPSGWA